MEFLDKIIRFNVVKQLYKNKYRPEVNAVNIIDECLETLHFHKEDGNKRDLYAHEIVDRYKNKEICNDFNATEYKNYTLEQYADFLDDNIDILIYAIGDMVKVLNTLGIFDHRDIGESSKLIGDLIEIVADANLTKAGKINQDGKLTKDTEFVPPNEKILQLLKNKVETRLKTL